VEGRGRPTALWETGLIDPGRAFLPDLAGWHNARSPGGPASRPVSLVPAFVCAESGSPSQFLLVTRRDRYGILVTLAERVRAACPRVGGPNSLIFIVFDRQRGISDPVHRPDSHQDAGAAPVVGDAAFRRMELVCAK
jgi:hypothetical protein